MRLMNVVSRILFLATAILASFQIVKDVQGASVLMTICLTVGFGTLALAGLFLLVYGIESLTNPWVAVFSTGIPLGFSAALMDQILPQFSMVYLVFGVPGFFAIVITRLQMSKKTATLTLAVVHGVFGILLVGLPPYGRFSGLAGCPVMWFAIGGALMGLGGMLLAFLRSGKPIVKESLIYALFPFLLFVITLAFAFGLRGLGTSHCVM